MRSIKFRAWDGQVFYIPTPDDVNDINDNVSNMQDEGVKLMQYTGVDDTNGVEIYEGDIINITGRGFAGGRKEAVIFKHGCFRTQNAFDTLLGVEVVGNIYEDPELLK